MHTALRRGAQCPENLSTHHALPCARCPHLSTPGRHHIRPLGPSLADDLHEHRRQTRSSFLKGMLDVEARALLRILVLLDCLNVHDPVRLCTGAELSARGRQPR